MRLRNGEKFFIGLSALYFIVFGILAFIQENTEFLLYGAVMVVLFILILGTLPKTRFGYPILSGLSIWGFLHLAGGVIRMGDHSLYGQHLIHFVGEGELFILKYDQFVHAFGFFVATLVVYHLLRFYLKEEVSSVVVLVVIILAGMGLGVVNELLEFSATLLMDTGVGGYNNTLLDLLFNTLGACLAVVLARSQYKSNNHWGIR